MRFSLLALITLVTLVAVEMFTLKTTSDTRLVIVGYFVYATLLAATWGAFCCNAVLRQFCKGFAVLAWASVLYGVFVREEGFVNFSVTPLAKLMASYSNIPCRPILIRLHRAMQIARSICSLNSGITGAS